MSSSSAPLLLDLDAPHDAGTPFTLRRGFAPAPLEYATVNHHKRAGDLSAAATAHAELAESNAPWEPDHRGAAAHLRAAADLLWSAHPARASTCYLRSALNDAQCGRFEAACESWTRLAQLQEKHLQPASAVAAVWQRALDAARAAGEHALIARCLRAQLAHQLERSQLRAAARSLEELGALETDAREEAALLLRAGLFALAGAVGGEPQESKQAAAEEDTDYDEDAGDEKEDDDEGAPESAEAAIERCVARAPRFRESRQYHFLRELLLCIYSADARGANECFARFRDVVDWRDELVSRPLSALVRALPGALLDELSDLARSSDSPPPPPAAASSEYEEKYRDEND